MARTANVFARVEPELKEQAESVFDQLGIPMLNAVGMFLRQIVLQKGIPFEMKLPRTAPLTYGSLTKEQFDKEIEKEKINDGIPAEIIAKFYVGGVLNLGFEYLNSNGKYTKDEIISYIDKLIKDEI